MKKLMLVNAGLMMTLCFTLGTTHAFAQKSEDAAIKKVIQDEASLFYHKNYDGWANVWAHDTANYTIGIGPAGYQEDRGWNAIAATYKIRIQNLRVRTDAEIAPLINYTDFQIYVNGNIATATFLNTYPAPGRQSYTLVKQNGAWKIMNITSLNSANYAIMRTINLMKTFEGKWALDGVATMDPSNGMKLNEASFILKESPYGLEQISSFITSDANGRSAAIPPAIEYFIPDYNTGTVFYLVVEKAVRGQTYTKTGIVTSDGMNSFTVTVMYPNKPTSIQNEYTVSLVNGKWHQVGKDYDINGKVTSTTQLDMHRIQ